MPLHAAQQLACSCCHAWRDHWLYLCLIYGKQRVTTTPWTCVTHCAYAESSTAPLCSLLVSVLVSILAWTCSADSTARTAPGSRPAVHTGGPCCLAWHQGHGASACTARTAHIGVCAPQQLPKVRSLACWNVQLNQHTARLLSSFLSALRSMPHCCTTAVSSPFVSPCRAATQHPPGLQGAHIRPPKSLQPAGGWLSPYLCTHHTTLLLWRQQVPRQGSATLSSSTSGRRAHTPKWCAHFLHV